MERTIKFFELSTNDNGGAGHAALKGIESLRKNGYDAKLIVWNKSSNSDAVIGVHDSNIFLERLILQWYRLVGNIRKKLFCRIRKSKYNFYDIQQNRVSAKKILKLYGDIPDIIIVGWVTDFVSSKTIFELKELTGAKVLYVMTDNSPIGGGCHYPWDCQGYTTCCYPCPALGKGNHRAEKTLRFKHKYITEDMFISGTTTDCNRARRSLLFKNNPIIVSATLNHNPYTFDKLEGRKLWNISEDRYVIFCGASSINAERKGFRQLLMALEYLKDLESDISRILILIAGDSSTPMPEEYEVKYLGRLGFEELFKAYCCADIFACPSLEDSGPMMINYGVMAYLPVVAFEMGIAPDIILHQKNGYIAKWNDYEDFARGIYFWMHHPYDKSELKKINDDLAERTKKEKSLWTNLESLLLNDIN